MKQNIACSPIQPSVGLFMSWNMIAQMAERLTTNSEVPSSSPRSGSNEIIFSKLKSYCLLQHMVINTHGWMVTEKRHSDLCMLERKVHRQDVRPNTSVHGYWYRRWTETMAIGLITHMSGVGKPCCREPKSLSSMIKALTVYLVYYELKSTDYKWFNQSINQSYRSTFGMQCCVFQPANACLRMRSHGWKWSKSL